MPVTLFELTVPRFRRALGVIVHLLDRASCRRGDPPGRAEPAA